MSLVPPEKAEPPSGARAEDARLVETTCRTMLSLPVFEHSFAIQMLAKMAADEKVPPRDRCNCLRTLAMVQVKLMEVLAAGGQARAAAPTAVAQVVTKVEIVRERDWRDATVERMTGVDG